MRRGAVNVPAHAIDASQGLMLFERVPRREGEGFALFDRRGRVRLLWRLDDELGDGSVIVEFVWPSARGVFDIQLIHIVIGADSVSPQII